MMAFEFGREKEEQNKTGHGDYLDVGSKGKGGILKKHP